MYRRIFAFDFDGTLAEHNQVPWRLQQTLEQLRLAGYALFLVTGRRYEGVTLGSLTELFDGIVWENGAVLCPLTANEVYLPFGHIDPHFVQALETAGVPLEQGLAIVATWLPHEETVWRVLGETGSDASIVHNKGAIMLLPPGAAKGAGIERLLELCGFSPRNLVSFGDGENDISLLQAGKLGVAVADAVPSLKEVADLVTSQPGPAGVREALERYWLNGRILRPAAQRTPQILLGDDEDGKPVYLSGAQLAESNFGIFGDSGSGKSWVTGLLAEGMHVAGYQVLIIDPEGDYRGLRSLPRFIALTGNPVTLPSPAAVMTFMEEASISVVLDLCALTQPQRESYIAELMQALRPLRERKFRPHWIVFEEAQQFLPVTNNAIVTALAPLLTQGGWAFVSYRPDRMAPTVLADVDDYLCARLSEPEAVQALEKFDTLPPAEPLRYAPKGCIWVCGKLWVRLRAGSRRVPHIRHLYKYLDTPLPREKRFFFRTEKGYLGRDAASLFEFKEILPRLPLESIIYHHTRRDFVAWARGSLGDEALAMHLNKLAERPFLKGEALRQALIERVTAHYLEVYAANRQ